MPQQCYKKVISFNCGISLIRSLFVMLTLFMSTSYLCYLDYMYLRTSHIIKLIIINQLTYLCITQNLAVLFLPNFFFKHHRPFVRTRDLSFNTTIFLGLIATISPCFYCHYFLQPHCHHFYGFIAIIFLASTPLFLQLHYCY